MARDTPKCIQEFKKFYELLMQTAPEGYKPWFFPCKKERKDPDPAAILRIDTSSKGSWHHKSAGLNKEQCLEHIKLGYNIALSARNGDPLIIGDIDNEKCLDQLPQNTLTVTSRKKTGAHFFGWDKDRTAKINLPCDYGEMRSSNQYVLACGSFVPTDNNLPDAGYYTVKDAIPPRPLSFDDLPQFFKDKQLENIETEATIKRSEEFKQVSGKYTELFKLRVADIVGLIPASKRVSHPLHESETRSNFSLSKDGVLGHCWRHMVSLNAMQYLCVEAGYALCEDAGTPHKGRGLSKIKGDKKALEVAYNLAIKKGLIKKEGFKEWNEEAIRQRLAEKRGLITSQPAKEEDEYKNDNILQILDLIDEPESSEKYLDLGVSNEGWFYGFLLKGKEAILTSSQKILRNTEEFWKDKKIGENEIKKLLDYSGYIGNIAPLIAKETIKKYYTKINRNHLVKPKEIYKTIRDKILYYMDFSQENEIADVLTCWVIATYCYPLFYWFPHILINAPSGSGKSKCFFIILQMAFRGFDLGASAGVTPAQLFRTIEGNRGTMGLDEFERSRDRKNETQQLVYQIINASTTRDSYVIRCEQINKKWKSWKFPIFCPKIVSNITGINPTSLSRFICFKWLKTKGEKGKRKPYREKDKVSFKPIREDLHILILENWESIRDIYGTLELPQNCRDEDNWLPLFTIAEFIDDSEGENVNAEEQLKKYLEDYKELEIETDDLTQQFFEILVDCMEEESKHYTPKEVSEFQDISELLQHYKSPAHWIGKQLRLYKFPTLRTCGKRKYLLSKSSVQEIINTYWNKDNDT